MANGQLLEYYAATSTLSGSVKVPRGEVSKVGLLGRNMQRIHRRSHCHSSLIVRARSITVKTSKQVLRGHMATCLLKLNNTLSLTTKRSKIERDESDIIETSKYARLTLHEDKLQSIRTQEGTPILSIQHRTNVS